MTRRASLSDRGLSPRELTRLRLILSLFRDGRGQLRRKSGQTEPGGLDFEKAVAGVLEAEHLPGRAVFDIVMNGTKGARYGISCKSSAKTKDGRVRLEISNALAQFRRAIKAAGARSARARGLAVIARVREWHREIAKKKGISIAGSGYLVLTHDRKFDEWTVYWFALRLPPAHRLTWNGGKDAESRVWATRKGKVLWEYYGGTGGQFKFFPLASSAAWTRSFRLETPSRSARSLVVQARKRWPDLWK